MQQYCSELKVNRKVPWLRVPWLRVLVRIVIWWIAPWQTTVCRKIAMMILFVVSSLPAWASDDAVVLADQQRPVPVASYLTVDADYVALPLTLTSQATGTIERGEKIRDLWVALTTEVAAHDLIDVEVSAKSQAAILPAAYLHSGDKSPSVSESGRVASKRVKRISPVSMAPVLLGRLVEGKNSYAVANELYALVQSVNKSSSAQIQVGQPALAIRYPEEHRRELVEQISAQITNMRTTLGGRIGVTITGLERPVSVVAKDDKQVMLFLDYRLIYREELMPPLEEAY